MRFQNFVIPGNAGIHLERGAQDRVFELGSRIRGNDEVVFPEPLPRPHPWLTPHPQQPVAFLHLLFDEQLHGVQRRLGRVVKLDLVNAALGSVLPSV